MSERIKVGCIYRWNKPEGEQLFVYVTSSVDGKCVVSPIDLVLDANQNHDVSAVDLESIHERPIPLDLFLDH